MKKALLLLTLFIGFSLISHSQLSGNYTIDPNGTGSSNYTTVNAACDDLETMGVSASVNFYIKQGVYTEQVSLDSIPGVSNTKRVTFLPDTQNTAQVLIKYSPTLVDSNWVIGMKGSDWVRIEDIVIENTNTANYGQAFSLTDWADHIVVESCTVLVSIGVGNSNCFNLQGSSDITITNNLIVGGQYGIGNSGTITIYPHDILIKGNDFVDQGFGGVQLHYWDDAEILSNKISTSATNANTIGINLTYCTGFIVAKNTIGNESGPTYNSGIYLGNTVGISFPRSQVANNCVFVEINAFNANASGLFDLFNNTLVSVGQTTNQYYGAIVLTNGGLIEIRNNIVQADEGHALRASGWSPSGSDYNVFYSNNSAPFNVFGNYSTLEDWQDAWYMDSNSFWQEIDFVNNTECQTCDTVIDGAGTALSTVNEDLNGFPRNSNHPDIGAVEVVTSNFSLGPDSTYCVDEIQLEAYGVSSGSWLVNGNTSSGDNVILNADCDAPLLNVQFNGTSIYCGAVSDTVQIRLVPTTKLDSNLHLCQGESQVLEACASSSSDLLWSTGATSNSIMVNEAQVITVSKTELGCTSIDTIIVTQSDSVVIGDVEFCEEDFPITLDATITSGVGYSWNGGNSINAAQNDFTEGGAYSVTATDTFGCSSIDSFNLLLLEDPLAVIEYVSSGPAYQFSALNSLFIGNNTTYLWDFGPYATPSASTSATETVVFNPPWGEEWSFTVSLDIDNGCGADVANEYFEVIIWGVEDEIEKTARLFPNPASKSITVETQSTIESIEIVNTLGQVVYRVDNRNHSNEMTLDNLRLDPNSYTVIIQTNKDRVTEPLVILSY